jgi:hypothetical protein
MRRGNVGHIMQLIDKAKRCFSFSLFHNMRKRVVYKEGEKKK